MAAVGARRMTSGAMRRRSRPGWLVRNTPEHVQTTPIASCGRFAWPCTWHCLLSGFTPTTTSSSAYGNGNGMRGCEQPKMRVCGRPCGTASRTKAACRWVKPKSTRSPHTTRFGTDSRGQQVGRQDRQFGQRNAQRRRHKHSRQRAGGGANPTCMRSGWATPRSWWEQRAGRLTDRTDPSSYLKSAMSWFEPSVQEQHVLKFHANCICQRGFGRRVCVALSETCKPSLRRGYNSSGRRPVVA